MTTEWTLALLLIGQTATSGPLPETTTDNGVIQQAIAMCEQITQGGKFDIPANAEIYTGMMKFGEFKPVTALPDLLKRYAGTGRSAIDPPSMFLRFAGPHGGAWSVIHDRTFTCDVVTTGFDPSENDRAILDGMNKAGWTTIKSVAVPPGSLSQYLLVKMKPTATEPSYGVRALARSLGFAPATAGGVQMEINFAAGQLSIRQPTNP